MLLRAGYVLSSVHESIREHNDALADTLLDRLTAFDLSTNGALAATPSGDGSAGDASSMADSMAESAAYYAGGALGESEEEITDLLFELDF